MVSSTTPAHKAKKFRAHEKLKGDSDNEEPNVGGYF